MDVRDKIYIGGSWVASTGSGTLDVIDSTTEEVMATIPEGTAEDVDRAVEAAAAAFPAWSATSREERAKVLTRIGEALAARTDEIAAIISHEVGMPMTLSGMIQVGLPAGAFADAAQAAEAFPWEEEIGNSLVVREPVGVVGAITPWNYPLYQIVLKVAPALAAGCTVVLKPSEVAPLNAFALAEVIDEVGLPAGVFNLVTGVGPVVGEAIAAHPKVDMVSFTGSTRAGKRVMELAADSIKRVSLELGGKSANILLDDADFEKAVPAGVFGCYMNSGQTCSALTRMLVPRDKLAQVEQLAATAAEGFAPGDPFEEGKLLGPLVSSVQRDRVRGYINQGIAEGAKLVTGGAEAPEGLEKGFFVQPTVFSEVTRTMTIAKEEIFGPVLSI
ncbi:MAG TPA: aldehyde dehydrogenase family protein, partial [Acidimicrobiales bacterium]|nr:aldehyde dehydrogenase family protein [Acidimicrobiales bacterium]